MGFVIVEMMKLRIFFKLIDLVYNTKNHEVHESETINFSQFLCSLSVEISKKQCINKINP